MKISRVLHVDSSFREVPADTMPRIDCLVSFEIEGDNPTEEEIQLKLKEILAKGTIPDDIIIAENYYIKELIEKSYQS